MDRMLERDLIEDLEGIVGAIGYGASKNYLGVRSVAEAVVKAGGSNVPTLVAAENAILAEEEPAVITTYLPAGGIVFGLLTRLLGAYTGDRWIGEMGEGVTMSAASDVGEHGTNYLRRVMRKVKADSTLSFAGQQRGGGGGVRSLEARASQSQIQNQFPVYTPSPEDDLMGVGAV